MTGRPKRFALVHVEGNFDSVPSLCSAAQMLAEAGALVDVFTVVDEHHTAPSPSHANIRFHSAHVMPRSQRQGLGRLLPGRIERAWRIKNEHRRVPFSAVIACDPAGLTYAWDHLFAGYQVPFIYYSLEIAFRKYCRHEHQRVQKEREIALSRQCRLVITQDPERAHLLARENGLSEQQMRVVPNSPLAAAPAGRTTWLRDRLGLPAGQIIVLHAGSPGLWTALPQLLISAVNWPANWTLVVQSRSSPQEKLGDYWGVLELLASRCRARLLTQPVPVADYAKLVASADVGCAFYLPQENHAFLDDNIRYVGRSSGKTAYYLMHGIPVLTSGDANLASIVQNAGAGAVVASLLETQTAIRQLIDDYPTYSRNARTCFETLFDFRKHFERVLGELLAL